MAVDRKSGWNRSGVINMIDRKINGLERQIENLKRKEQNGR